MNTQAVPLLVQNPGNATAFNGFGSYNSRLHYNAKNAPFFQLSVSYSGDTLCV